MTAKRPNKPQRLSTLPATLTFNDYSDYEGAPESRDFRALPHRLSTLRLFPSDFGSGRHTHPEALAEQSWQPPKKSDGPRHTRLDRLRPCLDQDRPGRPKKAPRRAHRRRDMQAQPPPERPTEGHGERNTPTQARRRRHATPQGGRRTKEK